MSLHRSDQNPVYGAGVLTLSLEDEGGGAFFILKENDVDDVSGANKEVRLDFDELAAVFATAVKMRKQWQQSTRQRPGRSKKG
jgi:hypothetical protein